MFWRVVTGIGERFSGFCERHRPSVTVFRWSICPLQPVFRIRPDPSLFGLKDPDPDPKLLFSNPDLALYPDADPHLSKLKLKNIFRKCFNSNQILLN